jgi:hypothetical protein
MEVTSDNVLYTQDWFYYSVSEHACVNFGFQVIDLTPT